MRFAGVVLKRKVMQHVIQQRQSITHVAPRWISVSHGYGISMVNSRGTVIALLMMTAPVWGKRRAVGEPYQRWQHWPLCCTHYVVYHTLWHGYVTVGRSLFGHVQLSPISNPSKNMS